MPDFLTAQLETDFAGFRPKEPDWLSRRRREARDRFRTRGFPTIDEEEWKYTPLDPVTRVPFRFSPALRPEFPSLPPLPDGAFVGGLAEGLSRFPELLERLLGGPASGVESPFAALNTAFLSDGVFLYLPRGTVVREPIFLVHRAPAGGQASAAHPRTLILLEAGSQAAVVESYAGPSHPYLTNAVTEIVLGEDSVLEHTKLQEEGEEALHVGTLAVRQGRQSTFTSHSVSLGASFCRNDLDTRLEAEGAACTLNGLYLAGGRQHVDNHTSIDHAAPRGTSQEIYKGILDGRATGVFNGRIVVRPSAAKTSARQTNKNLLLSDDAVINTKPLLEIENNDVKCNHGATIGRLDENQVFYLRSRGLADREARGLLTYAFAGELVRRIGLPSVRDRLQQTLFRRFAAGDPGEFAP